MSRREALQAAGVALAGTGALGLAGCGSGAGSSSSAAAGSSSAAGSAATSSAAGTPKHGGSIQIAAGDASTSENLDPQRPWNQNNGIYAALAWETLVLLDANFNLHPALATSWSSDSSLKRWTFKLRPGVKFHDGSPLTADDVVWSIKRLYEPSLASPELGPLSAVLNAKHVRAADPLTVVADLTHPDAFFPVIFATTGTEIVKAGQNTFPLAKAFGTGPFKFQSFQAGQGWTVVRNENYWQTGLPYLDEIRGVSIPDPTGLVQAVTSGQSHLSTSIAFSQVPIVSASGAAKVLEVPAYFDSYIVMNGRHKPFDDVRVRQAVKLADNRRLVMQSAYQGHGVLTSDTPAPSTDQYYPPSLGIRAQEIAQAKALLKQAGYPNGLQLTLYTSDLIGGMVDMAVALAQSVAPAGIHINVKQHPAATYFEQIWLQEAFYSSWVYRRHPAIRVPTTLASYSAWHETQIPHTQVDSLLTAALSTADPALQKTRMEALLLWIANNDGYLNPAFENLAMAASKNLQGVTFPQAKGPSLIGAWLA
ncbi:MAG: ABC transporter substrate-binding protein [Solirubrobacteraceae bacterium]